MKKLTKLRAAKSRLMQELGNHPSTKQIAIEMKIPLEEVENFHAS